MARAPRRTARSGAGPGRGTPRSRTASRPGARASSTEQTPDETPAARRLPPGLGLTRRAIALMAVIGILVLSYASSLRVYLDQQHAIALAQQQIRDHQAEIDRLNSELARWKDPDYVRAQARERLGWVVPGEKGYRVLGPDGQPLGGGAEIDSEARRPPGEHDATWWEKLWGGMQTADKPTVPKTTQPTIGPTFKPTSTSTPKR